MMDNNSDSERMQKGAPSKGRSTLRDAFLFFKAFLRNPTHVGALAPSSRALADEMTSFDEIKSAKVVVELGCGTGAITECILEKISPEALYMGIELDQDCIRCLRDRFPGKLFYHGSAESLLDYLKEHGNKRPSVVMSGLPWAVLPDEMQNSIFKAIVQALTPDGVFVTFAYSHAKMMSRAVRLKRRLQRCFKVVETSPTVWANFPPAFFYVCRGPRVENVECEKEG